MVSLLEEEVLDVFADGDEMAVFQRGVALEVVVIRKEEKERVIF